MAVIVMRYACLINNDIPALLTEPHRHVSARVSTCQHVSPPRVATCQAGEQQRSWVGLDDVVDGLIFCLWSIDLVSRRLFSLIFICYSFVFCFSFFFSFCSFRDNNSNESPKTREKKKRFRKNVRAHEIIDSAHKRGCS